jgi:hypothetical protein
MWQPDFSTPSGRNTIIIFDADTPQNQEVGGGEMCIP